MSQEGAKALLDRFDTDPDFQRRVQEASTPAEKKEVLRDGGMDVAEDELELIWRQVEGSAEVPDEELDKIAGGVGAPVTLGAADSFSGSAGSGASGMNSIA